RSSSRECTDPGAAGGSAVSTVSSTPCPMLSNPAGSPFGHNSPYMKNIRAAVIGVGYLGRFHAQKYAQLTDCTLVGVVDTSQSGAERVANELGVRALQDY